MKLIAITLDQQIKEAARELALRRKLYPRWLDTDKMDIDDAEHRLATMEAILNTLKNIQDITVPKWDLEKLQTINVNL